MMRLNIHHIPIIFITLLYVSGILIASSFNTDFGNLDVSNISIPNGQNKISGLIYRPRTIAKGDSLYAVVLVHGISGTKEIMSGIALELARNDFIAMAIDLMGHGNSDGVFSSAHKDPTLGALAAVKYLESHPYVDRFSIGLVGHSLGAGIVRAIVKAHGNISSVVLIAGGVGEMTVDSSYGNLNSTYPKNLLFAVGMQDVLFNISQLKRDLAPVFDTTGEVAVNQLYGDFSSQTARKLITPSTTHLFEPVTPIIVNEVISWMINSLKGETDLNYSLNKGLVYGYRDFMVTLSFIACICLVLAASHIIFSFLPALIDNRTIKTKHEVLSDWKILIVWGSLGIILFIPFFSIGSLVSFPPLLFGSSFAWWLFGVGIFSLILTLLLSKTSSIRIDLKSIISDSLKPSYLLVSSTLFGLIYLVVFITETIFSLDLKISIIPVFSILSPVARVGMFLLLIPFYAIYFFAEGLYLHELHDWSKDNTKQLPQILSVLKVVGIRICPYVTLLSINYLPLFFWNLRILPVYFGFLMEFFVGIIPLFIVSAVLSWWMYRNTTTISIGAILNTFLFAWSSAAIFPLNA